MLLVVKEAVRITRASSGSVVLINSAENVLDIQASWGLPEDSQSMKLKVGEGITGWVAEYGQPARVDDVTIDSRYVQARENVRSELAVPLKSDGTIKGVLNVDSDREKAFSESDQELLTGLADQATQVIENTWTYAQLGLKARLFEALVKVSQAVSNALIVDDALRVITGQAAQLMEAQLCSLLLLDETGEWLDVRACHGGTQVYRQKPRLSVNESLAGVVLRRGKPAQIENVQTSSKYQQASVARQEGLVSLLSVPLMGSDTAIGVLNVYKKTQHRYSNEEIRILQALAELSTLAISKARLYERLLGVEEALRQNEKLSALGLLAAEVAHEIRNPLTVMKMLYHSLDLRFPDSDPRQRDAHIIGEKMDLLNRIVERILAFARKSEPRFQQIELNRVLEDLNLLIRHKLAQQGIEGRLYLDPSQPIILADATQLEQVFLNLALNAVQSMGSGGLLTIRTLAADPDVIVEIIDTGEGMTAEEGHQAFSSILQSTKPGGVGLGIAVVRRVLEAHHARFQWTSTPGKGTAVRICFSAIHPENRLKT
ncbi:MAG: GAF domain-containing protein [Verrucomicrobia bacterium]|nr:GAF domain-containing protein [Verrucomicrobiota bacterium]